MLARRLNVAHLTPAYFSPDSYVGGGERYVDYIVQSLRSIGAAEQCVFTLGPEDRLFERDGVTVRVMRNESVMPGPVNGFSAVLWRELPGFDLVHLHQCLTVFGAYTTAIARSLEIPIIGTDHGGGDNPIMLRGRGVELLSGMISQSRYAYSLIEKYFSGPHQILIGPVDTERLRPATDRRRDQRAVLCVSRIMPHKGIDRIIAALPSEMPLTVVGRVYHEEYYGLLQRMAEGKRVRFLLDADDDVLLDLYRTSGLFVQASCTQDVYHNYVSKPELMGLTTLEAMASGLPVVVSDAGSLPELVPDSRFGRIFRDTDELAFILRSVVSGAWPEPDAGALARAHAVEAHGMETIGRRLIGFYESILASCGG